MFLSNALSSRSADEICGQKELSFFSKIRSLYAVPQRMRTLRSSVLLEKLVVTQPVKKFPAFMEPEGTLPCLQGTATEALCNISQQAVFLRREVVTPSPNLHAAATAYSIYSQLLCIFGGFLLHPQPKDADPHNMGYGMTYLEILQHRAGLPLP
jgi:hypothetical protein